MDNLTIIENLKKDLPKTEAVIGYGSGIFKQTGYNETDIPDKDVILVVPDFKEFLINDYDMNPDHFSKDFDKKRLYDKKEKSNFYNNLGCLKFYHDNIHFKAMIISRFALDRDLETWKYFGMAGRLTKPIIYKDIPQTLEKAIKLNRQNISSVALLLTNKDKIKEEDFYTTISKITYMYDFRTILPGEKKTKAEDIVSGALPFFKQTYKPYVTCKNGIIYNSHPIELIDDLPTNLKNTIYAQLKVQSPDQINKKDIHKIRRIITKYFRDTNFPNSIKLALSSSVTLGKRETIKHGMQKVKKHFS